MLSDNYAHVCLTYTKPDGQNIWFNSCFHNLSICFNWRNNGRAQFRLAFKQKRRRYRRWHTTSLDCRVGNIQFTVCKSKTRTMIAKMINQASLVIIDMVWRVLNKLKVFDIFSMIKWDLRKRRGSAVKFESILRFESCEEHSRMIF